MGNEQLAHLRLEVSLADPIDEARDYLPDGLPELEEMDAVSARLLEVDPARKASDAAGAVTVAVTKRGVGTKVSEPARSGVDGRQF